MPYYCTYGNYQKYLKEHYLRTGRRIQFYEMWNDLYRKGQLLTSIPVVLRDTGPVGEMSPAEFDALVDGLYMCYEDFTVKKDALVLEEDIIPKLKDVFIFRHPRYTRPMEHIHNYVELDFVSRGSCTLYFEGKTRLLREGELCIIAPGSRHDVEVTEDDTFVFTIMLRASTFDTAFFAQLTGSDLLADFFRTTLHSGSQANYLLFYLEKPDWARTLLRNALVDCHRPDSYANNCCVSWINLLFAEVLRNYSRSLQFYDYTMGSDFSLVLQYIQHNYQTVTLASLASFFHYSEPHLCTLIRRNTGHSFTELIRRLRMNRAVSLLVNTDIKITEIADSIGYHSADHFSRVFRASYQVSPAEYRRLHARPEGLTTIQADALTASSQSEEL